jgi:hypothetical protein
MGRREEAIICVVVQRKIDCYYSHLKATDYIQVGYQIDWKSIRLYTEYIPYTQLYCLLERAWIHSNMSPTAYLKLPTQYMAGGLHYSSHHWHYKSILRRA